MAINPIVAKLLVQAATDEQDRKRLLAIIMTPVIALLLMVAFILYLITSPLSLFASWAFGGEDLAAIKQFQRDFGFNQNLGIYEQDYIEGSGQSYEGIVFTDGGMEVTYYNQLDERWAALAYGTTGTIEEEGCGPTSMSIVISTPLPARPTTLWNSANGQPNTDTAARATAPITA